MKKNLCLLSMLTHLWCFLLLLVNHAHAQTALFISPHARVVITESSTVTYFGNLINLGTYQSIGIDMFASSGDQSIMGNFSGNSSLGQVVKKNQGALIIHGDVSCITTTWETDGPIRLDDAHSWDIATGGAHAIWGNDTESRFFVLDGHAQIGRHIGNLAEYLFPVGYGLGHERYRGFGLTLASLGATGPARVSVKLIPHVVGAIAYERYFPSSDTTCVAGTSVAINQISTDGWHCDGPPDYEYVAWGYNSTTCGSAPRRIIRTATGMNHWQDSIESVVGGISSSLCRYSEWTGIGSIVTGGVYRNFSDFAIGSYVGALPVTLVDVRAEPRDQKYIHIHWITETELNNDRFSIERSQDGFVFSSLGEVVGHGTTTVRHEYGFDDGDVIPQVLYYYRLAQVDYDGITHYSQIVSAKILEGGNLEYGYYDVLGRRLPRNGLGTGFKVGYTNKVTIFLN